MSIDTTAVEVNEVNFVPRVPPTDLIYDDGEPMESNRHRIAMNLLIRSLEQYWGDSQDYFVGGNMFVYYSSEQVRNQDFKGPDFFVVLNVDNKSRLAWVAWEEGGRYPDVIIELMSPSTKSKDTGSKKNIYESVFKTRDYFVFDPFDPDSMQGWHLGSNWQYEPITVNQQGWLWCETLQLWLGTWEGTIQRETATWLRFYDLDNNLVLLPEEAQSQRAEAERQKAEAESQRAEAERQKAEAERQRAEAERQRAERLAARLRELGEDV